MSAKAYSAAASLVDDYRAALQRSDAAMLARIRHPVWCAKRTTSGGIAVENRDGHVGKALAGDARVFPSALSSLHMCFGDFAIARFDDWRSTCTSFLLLFREAGTWRLAGEASVDAECGLGDAVFTPRTAEAAVLNVLGEYYDAVTSGDSAVIARIFAPEWTMKNHEAGVVVSEDKGTFIRRIESGPLPGYSSDRQVADVQIAAGCLAFVRVDRPSTPSTTVFLFMKIAGVWLMIDKAWTDGRKCEA